MAVIGRIREKMGIAVVIFVFVAISAFVLGDLLGSNSVLLNDKSVGSIAGESISIDEYQQAIAERESSYFMQYGQQPGDRQMPILRQQAWEMLIVKHAIEGQFEKVGSVVTIEEMEDMLYGKNVNPSIRQNFTDPATGEFNVRDVRNTLQRLQNPPEGADPGTLSQWQNQRIQWEVFQKELMTARARIKYENLMIKSTYVTKAEAELNYHTQTDVAEVKYLYVPYFSISDSAVTVTDADYQAYYDKNKEKYKTEYTRDLKFVQFPVTASAEDSLALRTDLEKLAAEFKTATEDSVFAANNSDNPYGAYMKYTSGNLPAYLPKDEMVAGNVKGPFVNGNSYSIAKVVATGKEKIDSARASHILFQWNSTSEADKAEAKGRATKVLQEIKAGANFEDKAREFGTDGSAASGGDLDWFFTGNDPNLQHMVKPFEKAVFDASKPGLLNELVETEFGYHIVKVTNSKRSKEVSTYTIAQIDRNIGASDASIYDALRKAEEFATDLSGVDNFTERASKQGLTVYDGNDIGVAERRLNMLPDARAIIQWLFNEADKGDVSKVFELQDTYVVAVMTGEVDKGYKPLSLVKDEIATSVKNEAKSKVIIDKLAGLQGSIDEIAAAYGAAATVNTSTDLKLSTNSIPGPGFDARAIGEAFAPENGKRTKPFAVERGVMLVEMQSKTIAPEIADYTPYRESLLQTATTRNTGGIADAIKEKSDITDKRYKFF